MSGRNIERQMTHITIMQKEETYRFYCRGCGIDLGDEENIGYCEECASEIYVDLISCPMCEKELKRKNGWKFCSNRTCKIGMDENDDVFL